MTTFVRPSARRTSAVSPAWKVRAFAWVVPRGTDSGLQDAIKILEGIEEVSMVHFTKEDVVRHKLVGKIIEAYNNYELRGTRSTD